MRFALLHIRIDVEGHRHPQLRGLWQARARRHHTDDLIRLAVENDGLTKNRGIGGEVFLPEFMTKYGYLILTSLLVFKCETTTERGSNFESVEIVSGDA